MIPVTSDAKCLFNHIHVDGMYSLWLHALWHQNPAILTHDPQSSNLISTVSWHVPLWSEPKDHQKTWMSHIWSAQLQIESMIRLPWFSLSWEERSSNLPCWVLQRGQTIRLRPNINHTSKPTSNASHGGGLHNFNLPEWRCQLQLPLSLAFMTHLPFWHKQDHPTDQACIASWSPKSLEMHGYGEVLWAYQALAPPVWGVLISPFSWERGDEQWRGWNIALWDQW